MNRIAQVGNAQKNRLKIESAAPDLSNRAIPGTGYWKRYPIARRVLILPPLVILSLIIGMALGIGLGATTLVMALTVMIGIPFLWRKPILGAYFLIAAVVIVEPYNMQFPDSLTDRIPLHRPLNQMRLMLPVTAVEALMMGMVALVALKRIGDRKITLFNTGPVFVAMAVYLLFVLYGLARGVSAGGDLTSAIWEVRTQFYPILMYLIVYNLIETKAQARQLMWIFVGAVAFKGLVGVFRLVVTLKFDLGQITVVSRANSLMSHEESLLFVAFLVFGLLLWILNADRQQLKFMAYATFPVALALLANQRRAGILAMVLSLVVIFVVVYVQMPAKRRVLIYALIALFLFSIPYLTVFRNGGGGLIGEPAAAVLSTIRPDPRDSESNEYRVIEGENVGLNIALNPYTGAGYGVPMQILLPLPDLTSIFSLWAYIPHNTILWVWLRLGILGFAAFWFMIGRMLLSGTIVAGTEKDPYLRAISLLTITVIMAWVMQGLVDMGITDGRLNMLVGGLVGLTAAIPRMRRGEEEEVSASSLETAEAVQEAPVAGPAPVIPANAFKMNSGRGDVKPHHNHISGVLKFRNGKDTSPL